MDPDDWDTRDVACDDDEWTTATNSGQMCTDDDLDFLDGEAEETDDVTAFELFWMGRGNGTFNPAAPEFDCAQVRAPPPLDP